MKFKVKLTDNPTVLMRRIGYQFQKHAAHGQVAFIRPLGSGGFPRFHIYAKEEGFGAIIIDIHLDAKRETYKEQSAHSGEYSDDGALGAEVGRLKSLLDVVE